MAEYQDMVRRFYDEKGGILHGVVDRWKFLREERGELDDEIIAGIEAGEADFALQCRIAKELADEMVCLYGLAEKTGIDLDVAFLLVMQSNMTKLHTAYGKIVKGPGYVAPDMTTAVRP